MKKKIIGIIAAIAVVLGLGLIICNQIIPNEYEPADDEIALHIQLDVGEDIGLLVMTIVSMAMNTAEAYQMRTDR